jgi:hypothetical protein
MIIGKTRTNSKRKIRGGAVLLTGVVLGLTAVHASPVAQAPTAAASSTPPLYSPENDPYFAQPYIDTDEWRDAPVRHRYVHGGFKGTQTRFSFYFPPKEQYQGRFFQHITPVPDNENLAHKGPLNADNKIAAAFEGGAYFVETNGGGKFDLGKVATMKYDPTISAYRANAASAAYSRSIALRVYNTTRRPFGYAYGGSGAPSGRSARLRTRRACGMAWCPMSWARTWRSRTCSLGGCEPSGSSAPSSIMWSMLPAPVAAAISTPGSHRSRPRCCARPPAWASSRSRGSAGGRWVLTS